MSRHIPGLSPNSACVCVRVCAYVCVCACRTCACLRLRVIQYNLLKKPAYSLPRKCDYIQKWAVWIVREMEFKWSNKLHTSMRTRTYTYQMFLVHLLLFLFSWWVWLSDFEFQLIGWCCSSTFRKPGVPQCRSWGCCLASNHVTLKEWKKSKRGSLS